MILLDANLRNAITRGLFAGIGCLLAWIVMSYMLINFFGDSPDRIVFSWPFIWALTAIYATTNGVVAYIRGPQSKGLLDKGFWIDPLH